KAAIEIFVDGIADALFYTGPESISNFHMLAGYSQSHELYAFANMRRWSLYPRHRDTSFSLSVTKCSLSALWTGPAIKGDARSRLASGSWGRAHSDFPMPCQSNAVKRRDCPVAGTHRAMPASARFSRLRWTEEGIFRASRYFATVRRAISTPSRFRISTIA